MYLIWNFFFEVNIYNYFKKMIFGSLDITWIFSLADLSIYLKCHWSPSIFLGSELMRSDRWRHRMHYRSILAFAVSNRAWLLSSRVCRGRFPGVLWHSDICKVQLSLALMILPFPTTCSGNTRDVRRATYEDQGIRYQNKMQSLKIILWLYLEG